MFLCLFVAIPPRVLRRFFLSVRSLDVLIGPLDLLVDNAFDCPQNFLLSVGEMHGGLVWQYSVETLD